MLSFLKILQNWPNTRFWIERSAVAPYDAAEKNRNMGTQLHSLRCTLPQSYLGIKIYSLCDFWCAHKLVNSEPFLDYLHKVWHLLLALCSDVRKIFLYRCTSRPTFSALNYCGGILLKHFCYLYEVLRCSSVPPTPDNYSHPNRLTSLILRMRSRTNYVNGYTMLHRFSRNVCTVAQNVIDSRFHTA